MVRNFGKNFKGKRIVVFGAGSNIGSKFILEAAKRGASVIAVVRDIDRVSAYKKLIKRNIKFLRGDITKRNDVSKAFQSRNIYATVNFAANFSTDYSKAREVNVLGEQNVVNASIECGVKRHIYISTISTLIPKPNAYGDTKREAERIVKLAEKKGLNWIILRFPSVLGTKAWNQPFRIIFPYLRLGVPKVPTDVKNSAFYYVTLDTVIDAVLAALKTTPNQTITVFDGKITIRKYLSIMEKVNGVRLSFLPSRLIQFLNKLFGRYFPEISGMFSAVEFLAHPPTFENKTMRQELQLKTRDFDKWIRTHFPEAIGQKT